MNLIKELRETAGLSQRELAKEIGMSRTKVYNLENDKAAVLREGELERLSKAFAKNIELAYVAGLFDRASQINITRIAPFKIHDSQESPMYISRIQFHTKHEVLANVVMSVFGTGRVCPIKDKGRIKSYMFYAHCESVDKVIDLLLPYVRIKREKLLILKEFRAYLEHTRDEYRSMNSSGWNSWVDKVIYDKSKWLTMKEFCESIGLKEQIVSKYLNEGRLEGKKVNVAGKKRQQWRIPSIYNLNEIKDIVASKKRRNKYPQEVLDRYEDFYNRIHKA